MFAEAGGKLTRRRRAGAKKAGRPSRDADLARCQNPAKPAAPAAAPVAEVVVERCRKSRWLIAT
jgi:hypothetical protein